MVEGNQEENKQEENKPEENKTEQTETKETKKVFRGLVNGKIYKGAKLTGLIKGRCDKCFHDFEQNLAPAGEIVKCPKCQNEGMGE